MDVIHIHTFRKNIDKVKKRIELSDEGRERVKSLSLRPSKDNHWDYPRFRSQVLNIIFPAHAGMNP